MSWTSAWPSLNQTLQTTSRYLMELYSLCHRIKRGLAHLQRPELNLFLCHLQVHTVTYEDLDKHGKYELLYSTRHFGGMVWYLVRARRVDGLIVDMLQRERWGFRREYLLISLFIYLLRDQLKSIKLQPPTHSPVLLCCRFQTPGRRQPRVPLPHDPPTQRLGSGGLQAAGGRRGPAEGEDSSLNKGSPCRGQRQTSAVWVRNGPWRERAKKERKKSHPGGAGVSGALLRSSGGRFI